ncbi:MAG: hypothetical protein LBK97_00270, partial [Prevotellaceae bacterium]|nr:hypothetical protein [Prevotellaceae bacterium]
MSNKKENFYGVTITSTIRKLDSVFKSRMLDYDNYPDYYRYVHIGTLYLKDGQTIDEDEEAVFEIMEQDKDKSLEIKAYVENKLAEESASYKHPVYVVTSSYNGDEIVHTLRSHSISHSRGQLLLGFYMKEEDAIAVAEKEWEQKGNWLTRLKVPYAIYRTHIKDFKVYKNECPEFHAHKGYSKKDWQVTEDEVSLAERLYDSYNCTEVCKYETTDAPLMLDSDCQELKNDVVWKKCRLETKLLPFEESGKWGFRDKATGLVVVKPEYDDCQPVLRDVDLSPNYDKWYYIPPTDKFTCVKKKGKQGIVNEFGVEI